MSREAGRNPGETILYLIGDAGEPGLEREPVLEALARDAGASDAPVILFLGDNIYPRGLPAPEALDRADAERRLKSQIDSVIAAGARGIFIPGNHDWDFAGEGRRERLLQAETWGKSIGGGHVDFTPAMACPGPETIDVGSWLRLVVVDTQWWLFEEPVEEVPPACASRSAGQMLDAMRRAIRNAGDRHVIVAGHHPLATNGPHGGYFTLRQHIFPLRDKFRWAWIPLPVIGSLYPLARRLGISDQDIFHRRYRAMRKAFEGLFREKPPLAYVSGHEHSLQLIEGIGARYQIVSGTGNYGHVSPVAWRSGTLFAASASGYVRLHAQRDGRVRAGFIFVDEDASTREAYSIFLE